MDATNAGILSRGGTNNNRDRNEGTNGNNIDHVASDNGEVVDSLVNTAHAIERAVVRGIRGLASRLIDIGILATAAARTTGAVASHSGLLAIAGHRPAAVAAVWRVRQGDVDSDVVGLAHAVGGMIGDLLEAMGSQSVGGDPQPTFHGGKERRGAGGSRPFLKCRSMLKLVGSMRRAHGGDREKVLEANAPATACTCWFCPGEICWIVVARRCVPASPGLGPGGLESIRGGVQWREIGSIGRTVSGA